MHNNPGHAIHTQFANMLGRGLLVGGGGWGLQDDAIILVGLPPKLRVYNDLLDVGLLRQLFCYFIQQ